MACGVSSGSLASPDYCASYLCQSNLSVGRGCSRSSGASYLAQQQEAASLAGAPLRPMLKPGNWPPAVGLQFPSSGRCSSPEKPQNSAFPPKPGLEVLIAKYEQGKLDAISALHWFARMHNVSFELKETYESDDRISPCFSFCAVLNGVSYKAGLGKNKKISKMNAAQLALDELLQSETIGAKVSQKSGPPSVASEPKAPSGCACFSRISFGSV